VDIGKRLRDFREHKKMSQGDIEARTGLLRCYISRVENGHTVPAVETLEKFARAFEVPVYHFFIGAEKGQSVIKATGRLRASGKDDRQLARFAGFLSGLKEKDQQLLLKVGSAMAGRKK
jgi:transcriptional regulator with XRE-family HTH domain